MSSKTKGNKSSSKEVVLKDILDEVKKLNDTQATAIAEMNVTLSARITKLEETVTQLHNKIDSMKISGGGGGGSSSESKKAKSKDKEVQLPAHLSKINNFVKDIFTKDLEKDDGKFPHAIFDSIRDDLIAKVKGIRESEDYKKKKVRSQQAFLWKEVWNAFKVKLQEAPSKSGAKSARAWMNEAQEAFRVAENAKSKATGTDDADKEDTPEETGDASDNSDDEKSD